ncbi:MAG: hypothetical protein WBM17_15275 [Anaerolineales bacterium]
MAVTGTALVWIPILAPAVLAVIRLAQSRMFLFDYLMPAELFPAVLLGGILLLWAALRARSRRALVGWSLGLAAGLLAAGQALAVATGPASGAINPAGWPWVLVLASIAGYTLAVIALGVGGLLLFQTLSKGESK